MVKIRNSNGALVAELDEKNRTIKIVKRGYVTLIMYDLDSGLIIKNGKLSK